MELERTITTDEGHKIFVSNWDDEGVWMSMVTRYASIRMAFTKEEAHQLLEGLKIAMGLCPSCESEEWSAVREGQNEVCECHCGRVWSLK